MPRSLRSVAYSSWLQRLVPAATWLRNYQAAYFRGDLTAGLTVGIMLIPQSMAYALLAGVPPVYGLYASLVPLVVYALLGTSRHLAAGIIAIDMLIVAAGLTPLASPGSPRYLALVLLLTALVGALQLIMGMARLGFLVNLLSRPVLTGFMSAAALIIAFSQLGSLLGLSLSRGAPPHRLLWEALTHLSAIHWPTLLLGLGAILVLIGLQRYAPRVPAALVVVLLTTLLVWLFRLEQTGVAIVGEIPRGLPTWSLPEINFSALGSLFPTALTLALVQFMSVITLGKAFAARYRYSIRPNRELFALGAANLAGSFFQSLPVSGSFSRTAVNAQAGARTPLSNVIAASVVALTLLFFTPWFYYLPVPALAAIIIVAAVGLLDLRGLHALWRIKRTDGAIALLTFAITLLLGVQEGVLSGIAASVIAIMYRISRPNVAELGHLPGTRSFRDMRHHPEARPIPGLLLLRIDASFSFANADFLQDLLLSRTRDDPSIRAVILDASSINDLDTTAAATLKETARILQEQGVTLYFAGVKEPVLETMRRSHLVDQLGADHFFLSPHRAVLHILRQWGQADTYLKEVPGAEASASERSDA
ncbi:sulfate permease, SulP family [Rhodothermus profundi]|uniref:Sulfate permease, SulP family n=2 Tax=Rhodothermus profundi TaxID=633813 RepID=A0A1M6RMW1_9BACT|nr:sulfate permease, SulP family [Rhodothermus profundi]